MEWCSAGNEKWNEPYKLSLVVSSERTKVWVRSDIPHRTKKLLRQGASVTWPTGSLWTEPHVDTNQTIRIVGHL